MGIAKYGGIVEYSATVHKLCVRSEAAISPDVSRTDLVGAFVDCSRLRVIDLMKLSFDAPVIFEVEGRVDASALNLLWDVVGGLRG